MWPVGHQPPNREQPRVTPVSRWRDGVQPLYCLRFGSGQLEGLVLQWAQDDGWVALVQYVLEPPGGPVAVQEWIPTTGFAQCEIQVRLTGLPWRTA